MNRYDYVMHFFRRTVANVCGDEDLNHGIQRTWIGVETFDCSRSIQLGVSFALIPPESGQGVVAVAVAVADSFTGIVELIACHVHRQTGLQSFHIDGGILEGWLRIGGADHHVRVRLPCFLFRSTGFSAVDVEALCTFLFLDHRLHVALVTNRKYEGFLQVDIRECHRSMVTEDCFGSSVAHFHIAGSRNDWHLVDEVISHEGLTLQIELLHEETIAHWARQLGTQQQVCIRIATQCQSATGTESIGREVVWAEVVALALVRIGWQHHLAAVVMTFESFPVDGYTIDVEFCHSTQEEFPVAGFALQGAYPDRIDSRQTLLAKSRKGHIRTNLNEGVHAEALQFLHGVVETDGAADVLPPVFRVDFLQFEGLAGHVGNQRDFHFVEGDGPSSLLEFFQHRIHQVGVEGVAYDQLPCFHLLLLEDFHGFI